MSILRTVFPSVPVAFTGQSLLSHAGTKVLTGFIDALGFRSLCEDRLGQFVPAGARHRPGRLLGALAVMLAAGGEHVSDLDMLRTAPGIFGHVPSSATVSRFFERTVTSPELFTHGFETLTRALRSKVWDAAGNRSPALHATAADPLILDLDATLVGSHSDKEQAVGTYKGGYGFAPFIASVDYGTGNGTGEILAVALRPGNAGANSAADHISVFETAVAQLPDAFFDDRGTLIGEKLLVRTDSAGASRKFLWHLHDAGAQFSVSYPVPVARAHMIDWISDKQYWQPALDQDGNDRADAWVINATEVIPLTDYPPGTNIYLRAEPLHPGAAPTLLDMDGHRVTAFLTNSPRWHGPYLDARHPGQGTLREPDQNTKEHWAGQTAVLRLRSQSGLGPHRGPGLEPDVLAPAHRPARRPSGQGLGYQTLALPALRDRGKDHHPSQKEPAPSARHSARTSTHKCPAHRDNRTRPKTESQGPGSDIAAGTVRTAQPSNDLKDQWKSATTPADNGATPMRGITVKNVANHRARTRPSTNDR